MSARDISKPGRETWSSPVEFVLSVVGFAVGLGNVWRFPYLCYKNGGGAFFIPYLVCLLLGGVPMFFLEVALGQYMSRGGLGAWRATPIFMGIGLCTTMVTFLLNIYYIVILAWALAYMAHSFTSVLPWSHCNNWWNTERCMTSFGSNCTKVNSSCTGSTLNGSYVDPVVEFWERRLLQISSGVDEPGGIVWELAVALLIAWILCYFCVWKGVKWTGKVVYFTATFPYLMLTVLIIRGLTLPGAVDGVIFYLKPDFTKLGDAQVWLDAGTQIFFSYAIAINAMIALGSYNKFNNNCYRQCILISCINSFTSVYSGFAIFSVLGFMAQEQGVSIQDVAESGPGLAFIAYPKAVTQMPLAPLWAILFFFMILILGLDSQFVALEGFVTVATDAMPVLRTGYKRELFMLVYCVVSYVIGLSMVTRGGIFVFQLFDYYSASGMVLLWACFFECIAIGWIYGGKRFYDNMGMMLGFRINPLLRICWQFCTPVITAAIFVFMWVRFSPVTYNRTYTYPVWAQGAGMCLGFISMVMIPLYAIIKLAQAPGSLKQRWRLLTTPLLPPDRIPDHWPDSASLRKVAHIADQIDDISLLLHVPPSMYDTTDIGDSSIPLKAKLEP